MQTDSRNCRTLPLPYRAEKRYSESSLSRYPVRQSEPASNDDFPVQSSLHFTNVRIGALVVAFVGITLSMLASFFYLFTGEPLPLPRPSLMVLSSLPVIGLIGVGCGVGIVLWIVVVSIGKGKREKKPVQKNSLLPGTLLVSTGRPPAFPPEPPDRQYGRFFPSGFDTQGNRWTASAWERAAWKKRETLEALHIRQRLQTLRLSYADTFPVTMTRNSVARSRT